MISYKDERLWRMARVHNVAQFVSISNVDTPKVRFSHVRGADYADRTDISLILAELINKWGGSANVRTFLPDREQGNPFYYGILEPGELQSTVSAMLNAGYLVIVNETIDVHDGGVSGVSHGTVLEFSPGDTPRAVEKPGVLSIKREWGTELLRMVYGFEPQVSPDPHVRTEFSVHPKRVGFGNTHTLIWETGEQSDPPKLSPIPMWPNNFSRMLGDKVFGLALADIMGLPVPKASVVCRDAAPFILGRSTGTNEYWIRTSPRVKQPGRYTTSYELRDPFLLLTTEDPEGTQLASVLFQESVDAEFSGATAYDQDSLVVQGVQGHGDNFMLGKESPIRLPDKVVRDVMNVVAAANDLLGTAVDLEWAHDGRSVWVVQMGIDRSGVSHDMLIPGVPSRGWIRFDPEDGLEILRKALNAAEQDGKGIVVTRAVGQTSHIGDLIRSSGVPARYTMTDNP